MAHGYHGKILNIDLGRRDSEATEPGDRFYRVHTGASLVGTRFLLEKDPGIDPLGEENVLTFATGIAGGNLGPGMSRFSAVAKSPLSGGVFESRCEGAFSRALKGSRYDALALEGKLKKPGYVVIDDGKMSCHDAGELWGKNTAEVGQALRRLHGEEVKIATIGPAGEKGVRFAGIVTAGAHQTQRGGLGAVMGSKNLKALVLKNPSYPSVADREAIEELDRLFRVEGLTENDLNIWQKELPGFSYWLDVVVDPGYVASRNGQNHDYTPPSSFSKEQYSKYFRRISECPGCANDCIKTFNTGHLTSDDSVGGMNWEAIASLAINLDLEELETYFNLNTLCQLHGLDPVSLGGTLAFAAECAEKGVLSRDDFGFDFAFGAKADQNAVRLAELISSRRGIGEVLAQGVARAARTIGGEAERYALHVKGVEMICIEPRCQTNLALGHAVSPLGPQGDICEHDWDYDTSVGWDHTLARSRTLGILERIPMGELLPEKVKNFKALNAIWSGCDGLGLCLYACAPTRYFRLSQMVDLVRAATGWDFSGYELMKIGARRNALLRYYNHREGLGPEEDRLPDRYHEEPIRTGRHQGSILARERFQEMIRLYYEMVGWDRRGRPKDSTLYDLHLGDLIGTGSR